MNASLIEIRADVAIVCLYCKEASDLLRKSSSTCTYTPCQFLCQFLFCVIDEPPNVDLKKNQARYLVKKKYRVRFKTAMFAVGLVVTLLIIVYVITIPHL